MKDIYKVYTVILVLAAYTCFIGYIFETAATHKLTLELIETKDELAKTLILLKECEK